MDVTEVRVLIYQTERATRLAELKRLGQADGSPSRIRSQRAAWWVLWRARGQAVLADTERRLARAHSRCEDPPGWLAVPHLGKHYFAFAEIKPMYSPEEGWAVISLPSN